MKFIRPWAVIVTIIFFGTIIVALKLPEPEKPAQPKVTGHCDTTSNGGLADLYGRTVTLHGRFDTNGTVGPFLDCDHEEVYLKPPGDGKFVSSVEYEQLSGKDVNITGPLNFQPSNGNADQESYFFFDKWHIKADGDPPMDISGP